MPQLKDIIKQIERQLPLVGEDEGMLLSREEMNVVYRALSEKNLTKQEMI